MWPANVQVGEAPSFESINTTSKELLITTIAQEIYKK
jgi:hypothetical protein